MTLPDSPFIPLTGSAHRNKTAFLVKFPQDVWERIMAAGGVGLQMTKEDSKLNLCLNDDKVSMDLLPLGAPTEIHELGDALKPIGIATNRLSIPFSVPGSTRMSGTTRAANSATPHETSTRANAGGPAAKLRQEAAPLARSHSSPAGTVNAQSNTPAIPTIPLKTRVVQHLALGPANVEEIVNMVGGAEIDVMRVVKVVGRQVGENPPQYSLQPSQYAKIKIAEWRYTSEEQAKVGQMAREAFDELEYPAEAEERTELERKLQEAASGPSRVSESTMIQPVSAPPVAVAVVPSSSTPTNKSASDTASDHASDSPSQQSSSQPKSAKVKTATKGKGVVAREMAKFRAEQVRASSAPGLKSANGQASPRLSPQTISVAVPEKASRIEKGDKRLNATGRSSASGERDPKAGSTERKPGKRKQRHPSPTFTSSEEEENEDKARGRAKRRPEKAKPLDKRDSTPLPTAKPEQPPPSVPLPSAKRKPPPKPLNLTDEQSLSTAVLTNGANDTRDPEELRDRYEELYPAYQLLTTKLVDLLRVAEGLEEGDMEAGAIPGKTDLDKMVKKWEKWHKELNDISRWFGTS